MSVIDSGSVPCQGHVQGMRALGAYTCAVHVQSTHEFRRMALFRCRMLSWAFSWPRLPALMSTSLWQAGGDCAVAMQRLYGMMAQVEVAVQEGDYALASPYLSDAFSAIDKNVKRNLVHKNTAARKKSQLALKVKALEPAAAP